MKHRIFKALAFAIVLTLMATSAAFAAVPQDVTGKDYEAAVQALMDIGAITGDTDGLFHPDNNLTRAQACSIVVKTINPPSAELFGTATQAIPQSGFTDLGGYGWAAPYINYASNNNIAKGVGNNKFAPGSPVTTDQMVTFVLRAAGYTDAVLGGTWPDNYKAKAAELGLYKGLPETLPVNATKWMAAQFTYNAMALIAAAHEKPSEPGQVDLAGLTYGTGRFDDNITSYAGKPLAKTVTVYTYGEKADYSDIMTLSKDVTDYTLSSVYKYKNVSTPAWYKMSGGQIVQVILPYNVGFSGYAYGVINSTFTTVNGADERVTGLDTLTATREITWLCEKGLSVPAIVKGSGEIYEMKTTAGEVRNIATAGSADIMGKHFVEITSTHAFTTVADYENGAIALTGADTAYYEVKDNTSVYVVNKDGEYAAGSLSNIREGREVRLYDISDDDYDNVDIVVINQY